jgi:predicted nucleotidyltransferase
MDAAAFLARVSEWARGRAGIARVALVGSYARGDPAPTSDIDLVLFTEDPEAFLGDQAWLSTFGEVARTQIEDWGRVRSLRVWYADGPEVEFGVTDPGWGEDPEDEATQAVIKAGYRALYVRDQGATGDPGSTSSGGRAT